MLYIILLDYIILYYIIWYYIISYYIILYYIIIWHDIILYDIILYHIILYYYMTWYYMIWYYIILYRCLKLGTWTHILVVLRTSIYTSWIVSVLTHLFHYRVCIQVWDRPTMLNWIASNCRFYMMLFQCFKCHCNFNDPRFFVPWIHVISRRPRDFKGWIFNGGTSRPPLPVWWLWRQGAITTVIACNIFGVVSGCLIFLEARNSHGFEPRNIP